MSSIKILSVNEHGAHVAACAAKISTTSGGAVELFDKTRDADADDKLIGKVLKSGHSSILEHIYFNMAVSASSIAEQFFIEFRLASFTVKSRRYVDFSGAGYYTPGDMPQGFVAFVENAFAAYRKLLELGIPKEDARFVLPRCFLSEFYISCNARELLLIISRMTASDELRALRAQLLEQLREVSPAVCAAACAASERSPSERRTETKIEREEGGALCDLVFAPLSGKSVLFRCGVRDITALIANERPRELEHLAYTFAVNAISYAGLTHLTRHRMLSLSVSGVGTEGYIKPPSARGMDLYDEAFKDAAEYRAKCRPNNAAYATLCGGVTNVLVTMNARELLLFFKLRCCNRAQWEIREIARQMLRLCREDFPELFAFFGPSCFVTGACPEGRLSCGKMTEVLDEFGGVWGRN